MLSPIEKMPWWKFCLRVTWVAVQVLLAYCMGSQTSRFFYQAF